MKVRLGDLRQLIREEYLHGVPEFVLRTATTKYVDEIRQQLFRYILTDKSGTETQRQEAIDACNAVLQELEEKANALLEDTLYQFVRQV